MFTYDGSLFPTSLKRHFICDIKNIALTSGAHVIKLFTSMIYHHSMVIPSFYAIKQYYLDNYQGMAVNYHGKFFLTFHMVANLNTIVVSVS